MADGTGPETNVELPILYTVSGALVVLGGAIVMLNEVEVTTAVEVEVDVDNFTGGRGPPERVTEAGIDGDTGRLLGKPAGGASATGRGRSGIAMPVNHQ